MSRSIFVITAVIVASLAAAPSALAKGVLEATVCGESECRKVDELTVTPFLAEGGMPTDRPTSAAPWYRATILVGDPGVDSGPRVEDRFVISVVPDRAVLLGEDGDWMPMSADAVAAYRTAMVGVEPLPAASMPGLPKGPSRPAGAGGADGSSGGPPAWPFVAGGLSLIALGGLALRRYPQARC